MKQLFLLIILSVHLHSFSQSASDFVLIQDIPRDTIKSPINHPANRNKSNQGVFPLLITFYQQFISDQLQGDCIFYPGCSNYAKECFKKYNPVKSILLISDRLNRCTLGNYKYYDFHNKEVRTKKIIDFP